MGTLLLSPEFWAAFAGLVTVLVGLYKQFLSEKARRKREEKERMKKAVEEEKEVKKKSRDKVIDINDSIRKQKEKAKEWDGYDEPNS